MNPLQSNIKSKPRGWISLSSHAIADETPAALAWRDHPLPVVGDTLDASEIALGVYGDNAQRAVGQLAIRQADERSKGDYTLALWYEVAQWSSAPHLPNGFAEAKGCLILDRIAASFRKELHQYFLDVLASTLTRAQHVHRAGLSFPMLVARDPWLAQQLLLERDDLDIVVHPARLAWDCSQLTRLASFKVKEERIKAMEVRNHSDIKLVLGNPELPGRKPRRVA